MNPGLLSPSEVFRGGHSCKSLSSQCGLHRDLRATVVFGAVAFLKNGHISSSVIGRLIFNWIRRVVVATGSCDRSFHRDRPQHIPSRGTTHVTVSCSAGSADAYLSGANSSP